MKQYLVNCSRYDLVKPEYTYGNSRVDFYMEQNDQRYLTEVKGCTLAAPGEEYGFAAEVGLFPDAPTERGIKHLQELAAAAQTGIRCAVAFVIMMNGIERVYPNDATHPAFGVALKEAVRAGVHVECYSCRVEADRVRIVGKLDVTEEI